MNTAQPHTRISSRALSGIAAASLLLLAGCAGQSEAEGPGETQDFSQELHDMLPEHIRAAGVISVAGAFDNPPNLYADTTDTTKANGIAPDLAEAMGELLGVEFQWVNTQWPGQLPGLDAGTYDLIWGQASVTEEREREIIDLIPYTQTVLGWLVPAGNPLDLSGWESACGKRIGITVGAIFAEILADASEDYCTSQGQPAIEVSEFQGSEHTAILSNNIDAGIDSYPVLSGTANEHPDDFTAVQMPEDESFEYYSGLAGIGISKQNPELANALAEAMLVLYENGSLESIYAEYDAVDQIPDTELIGVNPLTQTPAGEIESA
ncbi:hypothetical protein GCM10011490_21830 [Pseudoclavibacter endophyticus]|uniref:Transporter substrate-binding domain-containing protein n=1 Tax=Pseudoclavibacter endophyticus TaxID=1778590 RepID=A0A6H9WIA9_9MICO|nr:transporter substrate-binding domain-containing protein [Pseudoclavibacter endophyticus]KAB1648227.1 transporter substrate-binding domain-containing protein [Pseudoclavibacter endophyticus]GGA70823.1 hypothetical protein GCM10011490_21830 [Pseudoclavibacter endophyticus]